MQIRPFSHADTAALIDVWYESWLSVGLKSPIVTKSDLAGRVPHDLAKRWAVTVALVDDRLVGFLALSMAEHRIDQLFVAPTAQGTGVGSALFQIALKELPNGFWLSTQPRNHRARAFYERNGMTIDPSSEADSAEKTIYRYAPSFDAARGAG